MKKTTTLFVSSLIISGVLVACNSDDDSNQDQPTTDTGGTTEVDDNNSEDDQSSEDNEEDENNNEDEDDNTNDGTNDGVLADGEFEDQLELQIGDTGTVDTLSGSFAVTLNDVEILEEINGQMPELDYFLLVDYTVENLGDDELDAREAIDSLESVHDLERSGFADNGPYQDGVDAIEGILAPGDTVSGESVYFALDSDEYYLRVTEGLVASGAAKNQIRFTFQKSEIE